MGFTIIPLPEEIDVLDDQVMFRKSHSQKCLVNILYYYYYYYIYFYNGLSAFQW